MGLLIRPDGTKEHIIPEDGEAFSLEEMQKYVEGYIELIPDLDGRIIIANEEGKLNNMPINMTATKMWGDVLVGNVLFLNKEEFK